MSTSQQILDRYGRLASDARRLTSTCRFVAGLVATATLACAASEAGCAKLAGRTLGHATITSAEAVLQGALDLPGGAARRISDLPPFCRVVAKIKSSSVSDIGVELWMPLHGWNKRYLGTGNGSYAGSIQYGRPRDSRPSLASGVRLGYAVSNTDMGTGRAGGAALIGRPVRWTDFGYRSTHETAVLAKETIQSFYGEPAKYSYFSGCSTGGMQGLKESQQFPADYDGILCGAPGNNRALLHAAILWNYAVFKNKPSRKLSNEKLKLVHDSVVAACNTGRGALKSDAFLIAPQECNWKPEALLCASGDAPDCLTADQVEGVNMIYDGPRNPRTHEPVFPGLPRGSELGWTLYLDAADKPGMPYEAIFQWVFGPDWSWKSFDWERDPAVFHEILTPVFNAVDPDLSRFRARGGKIIEFYGWADPLSAAQDGIDYYEKVVARSGSLEETQKFFRLFLMPGVGHCAGGDGPDSFDGLGILVDWVEHGKPPASIIATHSTNNIVDMARPLCPYPAIARYKGSGSTSGVANFVCAK